MFDICGCWTPKSQACMNTDITVHTQPLRSRSRVKHTGCGRNSMPKLSEEIGGTKTKIYCQGNICRRCVLAALRTVKLGLTKFGNQVKPLNYSGKKKSCISYWFRADVQTYGHRPRYAADDDAAQTDVCAKKCQVAAGWLLLPQQYGQ